MSIEVKNTVRIVDYCKECVTREKGRVFVKEFLTKCGENIIVLDLSDTGIITTSFLDEIVVRIAEAGVLDRVIFKYTSEATGERLERVSRFRNGLTIKVSSPKGENTFHTAALQ